MHEGKNFDACFYACVSLFILTIPQFIVHLLQPPTDKNLKILLAFISILKVTQYSWITLHEGPRKITQLLHILLYLATLFFSLVLFCQFKAAHLLTELFS